MKLASILFGEAAKTPLEAFDRGVAAVEVYSSVLLLVNVENTLEIAKEYNPREFAREMVSSPGAIVGMLNYDQDNDSDDLFTVSNSAALEKFGPLAYQLVMARIYPGWLRSDSMLSPEAIDVWSKMYSLSNSGVYQRKWIGDFRDEAVTRARSVNSATVHFFQNLATYISEEELVKYILDHGKHPRDFGFFWAYRKRATDPKASELFARGKQLLEELPKEYDDYLNTVGNLFFRKMYHP
jgi:hypothetical protein